MSRKKSSSDIVTRMKKVKVGRLIYSHGEPMLLVGPESNHDVFTLDDMAIALYGPGAKCHVEK